MADGIFTLGSAKKACIILLLESEERGASMADERSTVLAVGSAREGKYHEADGAQRSRKRKVKQVREAWGTGNGGAGQAKRRETHFNACVLLVLTADTCQRRGTLSATPSLISPRPPS